MEFNNINKYMNYMNNYANVEEIRKNVIIMDESENNDRLKLRQKVVSRGRSELSRKIKNGTFIELSKSEHGIMDEKDVMLDREFLDDMIKEIEKSRLRSLVYDPDFQKEELNEWIEEKDKKDRKQRISMKIKQGIKLKTEKKNTENNT